MALKERKAEYETTGNANYHKGEHTSRKDAMTGGYSIKVSAIRPPELAHVQEENHVMTFPLSAFVGCEIFCCIEQVQDMSQCQTSQ